MTTTASDRQAAYTGHLARYRTGLWRAPMFFEMVAADVQPGSTVVDIGCGHGFDGSDELQAKLAAMTGRFIGIEPDTEIALGAHFTETHRALFHQAPLAEASVDLAYAIMVLEHVSDPAEFFQKLHQVLKPGGVFWGLTVDRRHYFCTISRWMDQLNLKSLYLNVTHGKRGEERYENYPVFYRCNAPEDYERMASQFASRETFNFSREGMVDSYLPVPLRPVSHWFDRRRVAAGQPGTLLAVRIQKGHA